MSIIKHVTLQKIVAHDFRYDSRIIIIIIIINFCTIILTWLPNALISFDIDILLDFQHLRSMITTRYLLPLFKQKFRKTKWFSYNMYF